MRMVRTFLLATAIAGVTVSLGKPVVKGDFEVVKNGEIFSLIYEAPGKSMVSVQITDTGGNEIFSEKIISSDGFIRPYNFSQLPEGDYTLRLSDSNGEAVETLTHEEKQWITRFAKVDTKEPKFMVAVPDQGPCDLEVSIYDNEHRLVFSETNRIDAGFARIYHLVDITSGTIYLKNQTTGEERSYNTD